MDDSAMPNIKNTVLALLKSLECSICLELLKTPVSTGCGHFFCRFCITEVAKANYRSPCPLCKKPFTRRAIQDAAQRQSIILAAKDLAKMYGETTGVDFFSKECSQQEIQETLLQTTDNEISPVSLKIKKHTRKRKSSENGSMAIVEAPNTTETKLHSETDPEKSDSVLSNKVIVPATIANNKRQCISNEDEEDDNFILPTLDELLKASCNSKPEHFDYGVSVEESILENNQNSNDSKATTSTSKNTVLSSKKPKFFKTNVSGNNIKKDGKDILNIQRKKRGRKTKSVVQACNQQNALKNKTNQIAADTKTHCKKIDGVSVHKIVAEQSEVVNNIEDKSLKENLIVSPANEEKKKSLLGGEESTIASVKKSVRKHSSNMSCKRNNISVVPAEKETSVKGLKLVGTNDVYTSSIIPFSSIEKECFNLSETKLPGLQSSEIKEPTAPKCRDDITDTAISVQTVLSPRNDRLELMSKSPGWSRMKQVGKEFRFKKFSKLNIEKNFSTIHSPDVVNMNLEHKPKSLNLKAASTIIVKEADERIKNVAMEHKEQHTQEVSCSTLNSPANEFVVSAEVYAEKSDLNESSADKSVDVEETSNVTEEDMMHDTVISSDDESMEVLITPQSKVCTDEINFMNLNDTNKNLSPPSQSPQIKRNAQIIKDDANLFQTDCKKMAEPDKNHSSTNNINEKPDVIVTEVNVDDNQCFRENVAVSEGNFKDLEQKENKKELNRGSDSSNLDSISLNKSSKQSESSNKFSKIARCEISATQSFINTDKNTCFTEHSQQTSQTLIEFCGNNYSKQILPLPAIQNPYSYVPAFSNNVGVNSEFLKINDFQMNVLEKYPCPERTKVVKRTCFTLDEIQEGFAANSRSGKPEMICSLPFSAGEFKLQISVFEETLNVSVVKVVNAYASENRGNSMIFAEKNVHTSNYDLHKNSLVLPSSNPGSNSSLVGDAVDVTEEACPFPFLNHDSDIGNNIDTAEKESSEHSEIFPFVNPPHDSGRLNIVPDNNDKIHFTVDSFTSHNYQKQVTHEKENGSNYVENLPETQPFCRLQEKNACQVIMSANETSSFVSQVPEEKALEVNISNVEDHEPEVKDLSPIPKEQNSLHRTVSFDFEKQKEVGITQKVSKELDVLLNSNIPSSDILGVNDAASEQIENLKSTPKKDIIEVDCSLLKRSYNQQRILECPEEPNDPYMTFANEQVAPLKNLFKKIDSSKNKEEEKCAVTEREGSNSAQVALKSLDELLFGKNNESSTNISTTQKQKRLSLKTKRSQKKFRRIQNNSESDSSESESHHLENPPAKRLSASENDSANETLQKENVQNSLQNSIQLNSFLSSDLTIENSEEIVMELDSLEKKIKSVMAMLHTCGQCGLEKEDKTKPCSKCESAKQMEDNCASDTSQHSTDIFPLFIPPTPP